MKDNTYDKSWLESSIKGMPKIEYMSLARWGLPIASALFSFSGEVNFCVNLRSKTAWIISFTETGVYYKQP